MTSLIRDGHAPCPSLRSPQRGPFVQPSPAWWTHPPKSLTLSLPLMLPIFLPLSVCPSLQLNI